MVRNAGVRKSCSRQCVDQRRSQGPEERGPRLGRARGVQETAAPGSHFASDAEQRYAGSRKDKGGREECDEGRSEQVMVYITQTEPVQQKIDDGARHKLPGLFRRVFMTSVLKDVALRLQLR